jgi:hypothetical protein
MPLALQVGKRRRYRYYTFDDAATLAAARADIAGFVSRLEKRARLDEVLDANAFARQAEKARTIS